VNGHPFTTFSTAAPAVGAGTFGPRTAGFRILYLMNSLIGMSVISLTLTYLMQVYTAVYRRNAAAMSLHLASGETGDASELIAGLGPEGQFTGGYTNLSEIATQMSALKESHHFYPVLFYFRFAEPHYAVSRTTLVSLDTISLIKSGLDDARYGWLKESAAVTQLWRACLIMTTKLAETFLPDDHPDPNEKPDASTAALAETILCGTASLPAGRDRHHLRRASGSGHVSGAADGVADAHSNPGSRTRI